MWGVVPRCIDHGIILFSNCMERYISDTYILSQCVVWYLMDRSQCEVRIDHSCRQFYAKISGGKLAAARTGSDQESGNDQCSTCNVFLVSHFWFQWIVFLELFTADLIRNLEMTNAPLRIHNSAEIYPWVGTQRVEKWHSSGPKPQTFTSSS